MTITGTARTWTLAALLLSITLPSAPSPARAAEHLAATGVVRTGSATATPAPPAEGFGAGVFSTGQSRFDPGVPNQGWWSNATEAQDMNDSIAVGGWGDGTTELRNFFTFDLSKLRGHVVQARLEFYTGYVVGDAQETLGLYDVTTPARALNANDGVNGDIFRDLGTGHRYARVRVGVTQSEEWLSIRLNEAAIRDINAARRHFSIGGRLLSIDKTPFAGEQVIGLYTHDRGLTARLLVRTAPIWPTP